MYPNGYGIGTGNSLSLYLLSESNGNDYVRAKLRVLNQYSSNHVEKQGQSMVHYKYHFIVLYNVIRSICIYVLHNEIYYLLTCYKLLMKTILLLVQQYRKYAILMSLLKIMF